MSRMFETEDSTDPEYYNRLAKKEESGMKIESVIFRRDEVSNWEDGVMIGEGCGPLIDLAGHVVPAPIWSWHPSYDFVVKARETEMSKQYNRAKKQS